MDAGRSLRLTTAPTVEPVSISEAITQLQIGADVSVDSGDDTASSDFDNTTNPLTVTDAVTTYTGCDFTVNHLFKIDDEIFEVQSVSGNNVTFKRGVLDTEVEAHADSADILKGTADEEAIATFICAARKDLEEQTLSAFVNQTWTLKLDRFPNWGSIRLPRPPLSSVTSIQYVDTNEATQTWSSSLYTVDADSMPGRVRPALNQIYPTTSGHIHDVTITYVAGYGSTAADVPKGIKQAILIRTEMLYRGCDHSMAVDSLISPYCFRVGAVV